MTKLKNYKKSKNLKKNRKKKPVKSKTLPTSENISKLLEKV